MGTSAPHATLVAGPARADGVRSDHRPRLAGSGASAALVVVASTALGAVLRIAAIDQSLFGDELSTYWIVATHDLPGTVSVLHDTLEITPPLYVRADVDRRPDRPHARARTPPCADRRRRGDPDRLPRRIAHDRPRRGRRRRGAHRARAVHDLLLGRGARLSADARPRHALDAGAARRRSTAAGRAGGSPTAPRTSAAAYTHYTCVFALAAQLAWVLWAHPEARRAALLANAGAVIAFLPWISGFLDDLSSPDGRIMSALSPLTPDTARLAIEHWSVGYPLRRLDHGAARPAGRRRPLARGASASRSASPARPWTRPPSPAPARAGRPPAGPRRRAWRWPRPSARRPRRCSARTCSPRATSPSRGHGSRSRSRRCCVAAGPRLRHARGRSGPGRLRARRGEDGRRGVPAS